MSKLQLSLDASVQKGVFEIHLVLEGPSVLGGSVPREDLARAAGFTGKAGQVLVGYAEGLDDVVLYVGLGSEPDAEAFRAAGAQAMRSLAKDIARAQIVVGESSAGNVAALVEGAILGHYRYDALRGAGFDAEKTLPSISELAVVSADPELRPLFDRAVVVSSAQCLARDLINEHAATMTPERFSQVASEISQANGMECRIWDRATIEAEGLGGLMAVSRGSSVEPRFVKISYRPNSGSVEGTVALVGKGITFDSGGLSLKSGDGMMTMKTDMSGAAAVLAAMSTLRSLGIGVAVDGYMALTENMPSGSATKPGDVLVARNGKSIEVLNTDAEGRLVLADALSLAAEDGASEIIDLATLTGACVVALGREIAGVMGNSQTLVDAVLKSGERSGEPLWQLPLPERYKKHIESEIADMKNIGAPGAAGTLSAALLLQEFVAQVPWVHVDIAGPSRSEGDERYFRKGGTGFGVRTICEFLLAKQA